MGVCIFLIKMAPQVGLEPTVSGSAISAIESTSAASDSTDTTKEDGQEGQESQAENDDRVNRDKAFESRSQG